MSFEITEDQLKKAEEYVLFQNIIPEDFFDYLSGIEALGKIHAFGFPGSLAKEAGFSLRTARHIVFLWAAAKNNDSYFDRVMKGTPYVE